MTDNPAPRPLFVKGAPPEALAIWTAEVEAMAPRKRKLWKGHMRHVSGAVSQVRWRQDGFIFKPTAAVLTELPKNTILAKDGWTPIFAFGSRPSREQLLASFDADVTDVVKQDNFKGLLPLDEAATIGENIYKQEGLKHWHDRIALQVEERHTGNHHRNHTVAIPAASGQPVRG